MLCPVHCSVRPGGASETLLFKRSSCGCEWRWGSAVRQQNFPCTLQPENQQLTTPRHRTGVSAAEEASAVFLLSRLCCSSFSPCKCNRSTSCRWSIQSVNMFCCLPLTQLRLLTSVLHQHMSCGFSGSQLGFSNTSSLTFSNDHFISKRSQDSLSPQSPSGSELTASHSAPIISAIVEDLDALAALAQQSTCRNQRLSAATLSSKEVFFRCKCRFCSRVFSSSSALQIHLRSCAREQMYICSICGNRFCTEGGLKLHFRGTKRHTHTSKWNLMFQSTT